MPIDRLQLSRQIGELANYLDEQRGEFSRQLTLATQTARDISAPDHFDSMRERIEQYQLTHSVLIAGVLEPLTNSHSPSASPHDYIVLAVDGSQIEIDRDSPFDAYLINVGRVYIQYGAQPDAMIESQAHTYYKQEDLVLGGRRRPGREHVIGSSVIAARRDTAEVSALADMAEQLPENVPAIGLLDGSLTQWRISEADNIADPDIRNQYLDALSRMQEVSKQREFVVASYISRPRAREVVNAIRVANCPHETSGSDHDSEEFPRVRDRDVFSELLKDGGDRSGVLKNHGDEVSAYGAHAPHFLYLQTEREVARIEVPEWTLNRLELLHALLWDQIRLGDGYPLAHAEADEEAVVRADDRALFRQLLENEAMNRSALDRTSAKSTAKRQRSL